MFPMCHTRFSRDFSRIYARFPRDFSRTHARFPSDFRLQRYDNILRNRQKWEFIFLLSLAEIHFSLGEPPTTFLTAHRTKSV